MLITIDSYLREFFNWLKVDMDPRPRAWGTWHVTFTIVGFTLTILAVILITRKHSEKLFDRVLRGVGFFLISCEVIKLLYNYYALCNSNYNDFIYLFPFQLCSVPMYFSVIASYLKRGSKARTAMLAFMMTYTLMSGFAAFVEPSGILNTTYLSTIHSCVWHMLLVFIGLLIGCSGEIGGQMRHFRYAFLLFIGCCLFALALNYTLPLTMTGEGNVPNMFYIGPARSSLVVFKDIFDRFGWVVQALCYALSLSLGAFLVFLPFHLVWRRKKRLAAENK